MPASRYLNSIDSFIRENRLQFEEMLGQLVRIPTVSMDPEKRSDIDRGAELAAEYLSAFGATARVHQTSGNPVVVGEFKVPGATRTLTIYNHMDVQPAQEPEWTHDPFDFAKEEDRYLGRGTTDDKGPALTALYGARYAVENNIPLNIRFLWEFEEEIGSPHFEEFLKANADMETDSVLVSDTIWISRRKPAIPYALRGMITGSMVLQTGKKDVHSGLTGGAARNPLAELADIAAKCLDAKTGKVKIPGFYDDVLKVGKREMEGFLQSGFNGKQWKAIHGFDSIRDQSDLEILKKIWCLPTFEVHGIVGGYTGPGVKTVVPPRAELKFSTRLVPNQKPEIIFNLIRKFVKSLNPDVRVIHEASLSPYLGPTEGSYADAASEAVQYGFSKSPAYVREGGSIGAVVTMQKYLKAPIIFIGLSLPEHGYHAPNENYDWRQASGGVKTFAKYFDLISTL